MEAFGYKTHWWSALKDPCLVGAVTHRTPALTSVYSLSEVNWRVGQHFVRMCTWVYGIIHMGCLFFLIWWTISSDKGIHISHCQGWKFTRSMEFNGNICHDYVVFFSLFDQQQDSTKPWNILLSSFTHHKVSLAKETLITVRLPNLL